MKKLPVISVIIPTLNEADWIQDCLMPLQAWRRRGHEIIVIDGGSEDATVAHAEPYADMVIISPPGRAVQMNTGAAQARGQILLFLHADTRLPDRADQLILQQRSITSYQNNCESSNNIWGRFDIKLSGKHCLFRLIETMINWRSRLTGTASGDQALFISGELFRTFGGYDDLPLMEDVALCQKAKKHARPIYLRPAATTSSRRWEQAGIIRTILLMWVIRLGYYMGVNPHRLARFYR